MSSLSSSSASLSSTSSSSSSSSDVQQHLLMHVPGFALQITVIWSSSGPIPSDMVLGVSSSVLLQSGTNFRHTFELGIFVVNSLHEG